MKSRSSFTKYLAGSLAVAGLSQSASAIDYTWDGGGADDNWGTGENWSPDGAPSPSSTSNLIFAGTTRLGAINNYGDGDDFNDITFASGAGAFTISNTGSNGIDWFGTILNSSTNTQTIGFRLYQSASNTINAASGNITLNSSALLFRNGQALTLTAASGRTIRIDSVIADGGGGAGTAISINGAGTVDLRGANTFTSGTTISNGTASITNAAGFGTGTVTVNSGGTGVINVGAGAATVANAFSGAGILNTTLPTGSNTLALSGVLSGFTGTLNIGSGTGGGKLQFTNATQGNVISSGATINVATNGTLYVANGLNYGSSLFLNGGTTGEALGQLRIEGGTTWSGNITLNANTTIGGNTTAGTIGGVISGSGFGFTRLGSGTTILTNANTYTGGTTLSGGTLQLGNGGTTGSISASSAITATAATTLAINRSNPVAQGTDFGNLNSTNITLSQLGTGSLTLTGNNTIRTLNVNNATGTVDIGSGALTISGAAGASTIQSTTGGTINATGGGTITLSQNNSTDGPDIGTANGTTLTINAKITGTSSFESWNTANGTGVTVLTGANDYTGNTIINSGVLSVSNIGNSGSTTSNLGQNGTIQLSTSANGSQNSTLKYTGTGETTNRVINFWLSGTNTGGIIDQSGASGLLKFTSNQTSTGTGTKTLTLQGSTAGTGEFAGNIVNGSGTIGVTKAGTGTWTLSGTGSTYGGGTRANGGILTISGSVVNSGGFVSVNNVGATNATLKVVSGATLGMSDFNMGEAVNSRAAIFQSGGAITVNNNTAGAFRLGNNTGSYGYYNMSAGTLDLVGAAGEFNVGGGAGAGQSAVGVMDVSGTAAITTKSWILIGRGDAGTNVSTSSGLLNITGGSISHTSNQIGMGWAEASGATSIINVGGGAGTAALTGYNSASLGDTGINLARTSITGQLGAVNLLTNGTLTVSNVQASGANTETLLNFNGGTLKATATNAGTSFLTAANLDAVHVYSGGGTIHNNGTAITIGNALLTNSGTGITNIAVTNGGSGYIGAPLVEISGGTGSTATAYANMVDDGTGNGTFKIGSITVTSNGVYTVAPTTVSLTGGGASTAATIGAITTGANVTTGGMTFQGAGTTTLGGANTYNGGTTVSAGTLDVTGTLADTGAVNVSGGTYKVSNDDTVGAVTLTSGTISNASGKVLTGSSYAVQSGTVSGILGGSGALTKSTSGTVTLSGANSYTGATAVSAGKLVVNGSITSDTTVASGATLGGSGTIQGNLTLAAESSSNAGDGGTLAAGNSPGVLTATGTTTFNTGSIFSWDLDTDQATPETNRGVAYDGVNTDAVSGGNAIFGILLAGSQDFSSLFWQQDRSWSDIFKDENGTSVLSNWASVFTSFTYANANGALAPSAYGAFSLTGSTLSWSAVPEPGSAMAGFLVVAGLLRRRR